MLLVLLLNLSCALQAGVRFDVFLGCDGLLPEATWFPVVFEVYNDGPAFNGVVQLSPGQFTQGQEHRMSLELPTGTLKRFVIPVFASGRSGPTATWDARLLDENNKVRAESPGLRARKQFNWRVPMFAAVTRGSGLRLGWPDTGRGYDSEPGVARLQPNLFPDNPITLECLSALYLNSEKALELKLNQVDALLCWLYQGGHLIVGVEQLSQVNGNEWLRHLLPCELTDMRTANQHSEIQQWLTGNRLHNGKEYSFREPTRRRVPNNANLSQENPYARLGEDAAFEQAPLQVATGRLLDGSVLFGPSEAPTAIIARRGRGQITVLTVSPEREPFLSWKNRDWFWTKIMGVPPELLQVRQPENYYAEQLDAVMGALIETTQVRKLPVGWLLLLLTGYLLVIGPLDQYWLKKINRPMLTWLTFPAYVAGFSVLIYIIGYKLRAGETEWNELHLVDFVSRGDKADWRGRTYASMYSPANARYKVASDQPFATFRGESYRYNMAGDELSRPRVEQKNNAFAAEIFVPVWSSQLYVSDWLQRDDAPLSFTVTADNFNFYLKVQNRLPQALTQVRFVAGGRILETPELPPRATTQFTLPRQGGESLHEFVQQHGRTFQSLASQRRQAFGQNVREFDLPNSAMAASFVSHLHSAERSQGQPYYEPGGFVTSPGLELSSLVEDGQAVLLAWVPDYAPIKPINQFKPRRYHRYTLMRLTADVASSKAEN